ncbi:hypothetical protein O3M35_001082 [Rhynocoris fuscipes]|uniref:CHK kinase-like domain-containing protein n=1 Tax=Rhynocoris fuscipes TaxID=488301 RepID=A0AAW1DQZ0_9HEMI
MSSTLSEDCKSENAWLETLLRKVAQENTVSRIIKVSKESIGVKGDNFSSCISRISLELLLHSGRKTKKTLIVKSPIDVTIPMPVFKLEAKIYDVILSEFNALMNEFQDPNDSFWCEMIGYQPYYTIVLEDLKAKNFLVANRRNFMDMNHTLLVLNTLGRLHGMSYVLLQRGLLNQNDLGVDLLSPDCPYAPRILEGGFHQLGSVIEECWPSEWKDIGEKFIKLSKVAMEKLKNIMDYPKDTFLVMNHGDCWTCNMMFKYSPYEESRPISVKFFDWPFANINSYILDILHFIHMCMRPDIRRQNLDTLYREYQKSLAKTLEFYGMPGVAPTLEQVYAEAKRAEYFAMFFSAVLMPASTSDVTESFYVDKVFTSCQAKECFNPEPFKSKKFMKFIEADIKQWLEEGFL